MENSCYKKKNNFFSATLFFLFLCLFASILFSTVAHAARSGSDREIAKKCVLCHQKVSPGIVNDWEKSNHAHGDVSCIDCHRADPTDVDAN